jgi:hypothetical protein
VQRALRRLRARERVDDELQRGDLTRASSAKTRQRPDTALTSALFVSVDHLRHDERGAVDRGVHDGERGSSGGSARSSRSGVASGMA